MVLIAAENICMLRNSTGKPFADLLDRLIHNSAATLGIPPSAVFDNPRTNHPAGGVDTQVIVGAQADPWGYFNGRSTWQYKAVALKDFIDSKVKDAISGDGKDYVRSLLQAGYAYRMCIADDGSAEKKTELKALLDAEIKKVNPAAPESIVLFASEIAAWVNTFPAIAVEMEASSMKDFFLGTRADLPAPGDVKEFMAGERFICVANVDGEICAMDNVCPHWGGPLGQGTIENGRIVCPWHGWSYDPKTGETPRKAGVRLTIFKLRMERDDVFVEMAQSSADSMQLLTE